MDDALRRLSGRRSGTPSGCNRTCSGKFALPVVAYNAGLNWQTTGQKLRATAIILNRAGDAAPRRPTKPETAP